MRRLICDAARLLLAALLVFTAVATAWGGVQAAAGSYRVELATDPAVIAVGRSKLVLAITDRAGEPVEGAAVRALVKMPTMDMGERKEQASPQPGRPGHYTVPVQFAMEGEYTATIEISGPHGTGTAIIPLRTGQNTGSAAEASGRSVWSLLPWLIGVCLAAFILSRLRRLGVRPEPRALLRPPVLVSLLVVAAAVALSRYAVGHLRRPGAMTPVEAQAMDMSSMPPPGGRAPVLLAAVEMGTVESTVVYTGSAAGYVEQDVTPRVTGWITWMPFYAGDPVRQGQLLVRLDTRELESRVNERRANRAMAEQMAAISRLEYRQALAAVAQARAEAESKAGALAEVKGMRARAQAMRKESRAAQAEARSELRAREADLRGARQEQAEAEAMLQSSQAMEPETEAMLAAMQADQAYWEKEIARMRVLLEKGAVSGEEFQREEAMAKGATAKVRQAEAKLQAVRSDIRAARARLAKAEAAVESGQARISQARSRVQSMEARLEQAQAEIAAAEGRIIMAGGELTSARANVRAMQAMADAGTGKIRQAQAGLQEAEAALTTTRVVQGYTEIRSRVEGVVTQRLISPGVLVNPGQVILKVAQVRPIRLQANVADRDLARVRPGARVSVLPRDEGDGERSVAARVTAVTPAVDPVARTGVVEALVPNTDGRFRPGQYVVMQIATGRSGRGLRVPTSAVVWESASSSPVLATQRTAYVWAAEPAAGGASADGQAYTVRRVEVRTGAGDGRYTEIRSGLEAGQQVVARGHLNLRPGDLVAAAAWSADGPQALPEIGMREGSGHQHGGPPAEPEHSGHSAAGAGGGD